MVVHEPGARREGHDTHPASLHMDPTQFDLLRAKELLSRIAEISRHCIHGDAHKDTLFEADVEIESGCGGCGR